MTIIETPSKRLCVLLSIVAIFSIVTLALAAATLGTVIKRFDTLNLTAVTTVNEASKPNLNSALAETIRINDLMNHLRQLQRIADESNGTRAIDTRGFNETVNYIYRYLTNEVPGLNVWKETFTVRNFAIESAPILLSSINNVITNYTYSPTIARSQFTVATYSGAEIFSDYVNVKVISNFGCSINDWRNAQNLVALVKGGGSCTYGEKGLLAVQGGVRAVLFYQDDQANPSLAPISVRLRQANTVPALFLSNDVGQALVNTALSSTVRIKLSIRLQNLGTFPVDNICADTRTGDVTQTIVVGSHSDSVTAGPGINDNGSGTAANLVLAMNLMKLYERSDYKKFNYRVRFCWWAAEEIGLAGSTYHVDKTKSATNPGDRTTDYLVNLNFDMAASPNFIYGIYNAETAPIDTTIPARNGSARVTELYRDWFISQNLPWDLRDLNGRSDYGPFLAAGIAAGGVATGSDAVKTSAQRDKYRDLIGESNAGFAGAILDPCYHKACDNIANIHQVGYEKLIQAAAYGLEYLGQKPDLAKWLYPNGR